MYRHILAASDFSDLGDRALTRAVDLAIEYGAALTLVHVIPSPDTPNPMYAHYEVRAHVEKLEESRRMAREALSARASAPTASRPKPPVGKVDLHFEVRVGQPAEEILAACAEHAVDLVVVGSSGKRGLQRWILGSTAEMVVRGCERDVLVVGGPHPVVVAPPG